MKTLATALMISASLLAGAAQADDSQVNPYPIEATSSSSLTRAQVVADLQAAQAAGQIVEGQQPDYPTLAAVHDVKTRAEVQAELAAAVDAGELVVGQAPSYPNKLASINSERHS